MSAHPIRVSVQNKCPICGHPDWCMIGDAFILCMRVESEKPLILKSGEVGWLHRHDGTVSVRVVRKEPEKQTLNPFQVWQEWMELRDNRSLTDLSNELGVSSLSLDQMCCVWAPRYHAWAFPMRDGTNGMVGIRLRSDNGKKWAVPGSHQGLFIPQCAPAKMMVVCEGPTDTAAALTMGYFAVGRPSCSGGIDHIKLLVKRVQVQRVLIVADLDAPGLRGAQTLAEHLELPNAILALPAKDVREFLNAGGNRATMDSIARQLVWRQPHANVD